MESGFLIPFAASSLAALVTSVGIFTIRHFEAWGRNNTTYFICFAAGVLISVSFLHIVPKSFTMNLYAPTFLLGGFLLMHLFNWVITAFACHRDPDARVALGLIPLLGIGFHSFIDGTIYSITFTASLLTGTLAAIGMVLHEFPEGIITYLLLLRGGFSEKNSLLLSFLAAALSTPLGMLISYPWVAKIDDSHLGALLALTAGILIYVGATHLLPQAEKERKRFSLLTLGAGIAVALIIITSHR